MLQNIACGSQPWELQRCTLFAKTTLHALCTLTYLIIIQGSYSSHPLYTNLLLVRYNQFLEYFVTLITLPLQSADMNLMMLLCPLIKIIAPSFKLTFALTRQHYLLVTMDITLGKINKLG